MRCRGKTSVMIIPTISFWRLLAILIILVVGKSRFVDLVSHKSKLCEAMNMPCQIGNGDECRMIYYKLNSTDCRDLVFVDDSKTGDEDIGNVQLESYHYNILSYKQTGFNLTFSNISWNHLKFRFKQEGNEMKNTCREFLISSNSTIKNLFYDCLWSNETYEGKTFSFEYEVSNGVLVSYKKYSFRVPFAKNIDETTDLANWEIFIYVEIIKNAFGLTTFVLHWQPLPEKFPVESYNVSVFSNESDKQEVTHFTNVTCNNIKECKYYYNKWYGSVQFGIQPICKNKSECLISKTVIFLLGGETTKPLLIGIVSVTLIIPAMIYLLFLLRNYFINKSRKCIRPVPKILIIFTPSLSSHVNVVFALVEYLKMYCEVEPLVDEIHIFQSKLRDPFKWCNESFKSADAVVVVASPYHKYLRVNDSVYQNTDVLLLRLLKERLASRGSSTQFFVLLFPYCSEKDIPDEAVNLRRFSFPQDLNKMLRFIHKDRYVPDCLSAEIEGGKENYKLFGTKLINAIAETQLNMKKNKSEYERIVEEMKNEKDGISCDQSLLTSGENVRERKSEFRPKGKKRVMELAEDVFAEFPGRLDDLNLSGEERESLVDSQKDSSGNDIVNLNVLDL